MQMLCYIGGKIKCFIAYQLNSLLIPVLSFQLVVYSAHLLYALLYLFGTEFIWDFKMDKVMYSHQ